MPAAVKTNNFMLSQATLMLAPFAQGSANMTFDLDPAANSVGLIKNLQTKEESSQVELRAGVRQLLVDSQKSGVKVSVSAEVYEYTAKNMLYSLSLNRTTQVVKAAGLAGALAAAGASLNLAATAPAGSTAAPITLADLTSGTVLMIQGTGDFSDRTFITKVSATPSALTAVAISPPVPAGMSFSIGDGVFLVNQIPVGTTATQDFFSLKVVGMLANENKPVTIIFPKVKILKGFNFDFTEDKYGSMAWEIDPYFMTTADIGSDARLAMIGTSQLSTAFVGF